MGALAFFPSTIFTSFPHGRPLRPSCFCPPSRNIPCFPYKRPRRPRIPSAISTSLSTSLSGDDASSWPDSPFQLDDLILNQYRVTAILGRGSNAITYEATTPNSSAPLALKVLSLKSMASWKSLELFNREVAVLQSISHPSIPTFLNSFEIDHPHANDRLFILVQQKAPGQSLQFHLNQKRRFTTKQIFSLFHQLLAVLQYLSTFNPPILHRDIKPANLILQINPQNDTLTVNLVDFGSVAKVPTESAPTTMVGTFGYMPPEQFSGTPDVRGDLYASAATVLAMTTGRSPSSLPQRRLKFDLEAVIPEGERTKLGTIYSVMSNLLEPAPEDRYSTAAEALAVLEGNQERRRNPAASKTKQLDLGGSLSSKDRESLERAFEAMRDGRRSQNAVGRFRGLVQWGVGKMRRRRKPVGTRVVIERDRENRLMRVVIPPKGFSGEAVSKGAFAVAWTGFTAFWTVGVLTGGAPVVASLFSIPFWAAGVQMARSAVDEVAGFVSLVVSLGGGDRGVYYFALSAKGGFGNLTIVEGDSRDLEYAVIETEMYVNGKPVTRLVLREGTQRRVIGSGLDLIEQEWLRDEINDFLEGGRRW
eukprot:GFKZ01001983.1.p1 GENE.GFKZ01001983.1~~GFKZ01001983.1.p1  ORF type:complete len:590 (-),score=50.39 GFKZ01001983.1:1493-3262(-)